MTTRDLATMTVLAWAVSACSLPPLASATGSGGSTSASASSGGQRVCAPGTSKPCYTGSADTENRGTCHGGVVVCDLLGGGYGACTGEVVPRAEVCIDRLDEDCDGSLASCGLALVWSEAFGIAGALNVGQAVAVDALGDVVVTGVVNTAVRFGPVAMTSSGLDDMFVAKLDRDGKTLWARRFGGAAATTQRGSGVAIDAAGHIYLTGSFGGVVDFGNGHTLTSAGGLDVFVLKLEPSGTTTWAIRGGDAADQEGKAIAVTPAGNVVVAGELQGSIGFDPEPPAFASTGATNLFWSTFTPSGGFVAGGHTTGGDQNLDGLAVDSKNSIILGGSFVGSIVVGSTVAAGVGVADGFVVALDTPSATPRWLRTYGAPNVFDLVASVAVDSADDVVVSGAFTGSLTFGDTKLTALGLESLFLAKLDRAAHPLWANAYGVGSPQLDSGYVKVGEGGLIVMGGFFTQLLSFSDTTFTAHGAAETAPVDAFLATFDANGTPLAAQAFGNENVQAIFAVALSPDGFVYATGGQLGTLDFGGGPIGKASLNSSALVASPFLVKFAP